MERKIKSRLDRRIRNGELYPLPKIDIILDLTTEIRYNERTRIMEFVYMDANGKFGSQYRDLFLYKTSLLDILNDIQKIENIFAVESNVLIADFMGLKGQVNYHDTKGYIDCYYGKGNRLNGYTLTPLQADELDYHLSWDSLIPVIKKCWTAQLKNGWSKGDRIESRININNFLGDNIRDVYEEVVEFIRWYNDKNKQSI
jgi:hypothetical protein